MKTIIRPITLFLLSAGIFVPAALANAASFNNDPADYPTLQVTNYSQNPNCNTCWGSSVSANSGEIVSFLLYFHNTGSDTATQAKALLTLPGGMITTANVTGQITAQNASAATRSVTVNLPSAQTLTLIPGSVYYYPNRSTSPQALPFGQSGNEVVGGGFSLGDLAPGWETAGYLVVRAQVGNQTQTTGSQPTVTTVSATSITQTSVTFNGSANANNASTNVWFEYGTTSSFGQTSSTQTISGSSIQNYSTSVSNLQSNTTYYYRAVAQNSFGTVYGSTFTFTTTTQNQQGTGAPIVTTNSAISVGQNYATLSGSVNPNNSSTNAWFEYGTSASFGQSTSLVTIGSGSFNYNHSAYVSNLQNNATYYYRVVAQNSFGTSYGTTMTFVTGQGSVGTGLPIVSTQSASTIGQTYATLNGSINPNNSSANAWFEWGTSQSFGNSTPQQFIGSGSFTTNFTYSISSLSPNTTYYYRAVSSNGQGTTYGSTYTFVTNSSTGTYGGTLPVVTTSGANGITSTAAVLNGFVTPNGNTTYAWFEYGRSQSLGFTVGNQDVGSSFTSRIYSATAVNLVPNSTYFYRAVASNQNGIVYGNLMTFSTPVGAAVVTTPPPQTTVPTGTVVVTGSALTSSVSVSQASSGDEVVFTVTYQNITGSTINNANIRIILPTEVNYITSNPAPISQNSNVLAYSLGSVAPGISSSIVVRTQIQSFVQNGTELVYSGVMDYVTAAGNPRTATTYNTVRVLGGSGAFASLFAALGGFSGLLLLALLLILIGFYFAYKYMVKKQTPNPPGTKINFN